MTVENVTRHGVPTVILYLPTVLGFTINLSSGTLMVVGGFVAWLYGQLVWRHGQAKARSHKDWVEADNLSLRPLVVQLQTQAAAERREMIARIAKLEAERDEAIEAERDLALACLINSGDMTRGTHEA